MLRWLLYLGVLVACLQFAYIAQLAARHREVSVFDDHVATSEAFSSRPKRAIEYQYTFPKAEAKKEAPRPELEAPRVETVGRSRGPFPFDAAADKDGGEKGPGDALAFGGARHIGADEARALVEAARARAGLATSSEHAESAGGGGSATRASKATTTTPREARVTALVHRIHRAFASIRPAGFGVRNDPHRASDKVVWETFYGALTSALGEASEFHDLRRAADVAVRGDGSIFVSISSFRDEVCPDTLDNLFATASRPDSVFVGLVQQNCDADQHAHFGCKTAVMPEDMKRVRTSQLQRLISRSFSTRFG